jgi:pimeloyl-ACP methyl ester carboxylesterase
LHGLGIGLWPYRSFFADIINDDPEVGIIALEFMPASMRITSRPLSHRALCIALENIIDAHRIQKFVLAGHSYGTVLSASILRSPTLGPRVSGSVLIDAIPFLLTHPAVAYNFVYRAPKEANEWQLWYFASRDPDIARTLARHFFWSECIMFRQGDLISTIISGS